jgi:hypothetical protein
MRQSSRIKRTAGGERKSASLFARKENLESTLASLEERLSKS